MTAHNFYCYEVPDGHVLTTKASPSDPASRLIFMVPFVDCTPHDANMVSIGQDPTLLCLLRLKGDLVAIAARSEDSLCDPLRETLQDNGFESTDHYFALVRCDVRDAMGPGDMFLVGPPDTVLPSPENLDAVRRHVIEREFEAADFDGLRVGGTSGWYHDGGDDYTCPVFLEAGGEDTSKMDFAVRFVPGSIAVKSVEFELPPRPEDAPSL